MRHRFIAISIGLLSTFQPFPPPADADPAAPNIPATTTPIETEGPSSQQKVRIVQRIGRLLNSKAFAFNADFSRWPQLIEPRQAALEAANSHLDFEQELQQALNAFSISHLNIDPPHKARSFRRGEAWGPGFHGIKNPHGFLVLHVAPGSPAHEIGIRKLDVITSIDGQPIAQASDLYRLPGKKARIAWRRGHASFEKQITFARFNRKVPSSMRWINDDVALIRIDSFGWDAYKWMRVGRFFKEARHAEAIVIDLRGNPGGLVFYGRHLAGQLLPRHQPYSIEIKRRHYRNYLAANGPDAPLDLDALADFGTPRYPFRFPLSFRPPYQGKVAILIDGFSASAADLFPAVMQEYGRAKIVGNTTSGSLLVAWTFRLGDGYRLYAPIAETLTPQGKRIESQGIHPDVPLSPRQTAHDATIIPAALQALGL